MMNNDLLAAAILKGVGGVENVESVTHCVTRLRFRLRDASLAQTERLKALDGVYMALESGGQYMVVVGERVTDLYRALVEQGCPEHARAAESGAGGRKRRSPLDVFIDLVTGIFSPVIGLISGLGLLKGLLTLLVFLQVLPYGSGSFNILFSLADAVFYFFPVLLGYSAAKKFGLPLSWGLTLGAALVYPYLLDGSGKDISNLFGIRVIMPAAGDYSGSLIPVICTVAVAAWLYRRLKPVIPGSVSSFLLPAAVLAPAYCLAVLAIGPVCRAIENMVSGAFFFLSDASPVVMGFFVGALWQVLVMLGLHWALIPIALNNMATLGFDLIYVAMFGTTFAQSGAVLAVGLRSRDAKVRRLCSSAFFTGVAGVTEPAIYGVTLPRRRPYLITCLVAGVVGAAAVGLGAKCYVVTGMGVFGYLSYMNENDSYGAVLMILLSAAALAAGFVLVYLLCPEKSGVSPDEPQGHKRVHLLGCPLQGCVVPLEQCGDPVFAAGVMGKGLAIHPNGHQVFSPMDGKVCMVAPTGHAVGIAGENGVQMLIHVGVDTVKLQGRGFRLFVEQGQAVSQGDVLLRFDADVIREAGLDPVTPVVITNTDHFDRVDLAVEEGRQAEALEPVLRLEETVL